ncbi:hypothetical protein [Micromonospora chokoriensis]|uniref:Uncharacterized protein n=1 Tax=Micromonospora chokoriensis TaxID=356851 RepID=A0A1C4Z566_9ACTN|nr:hypothetical protein [Micromonospora chokoriensis]SCF27721.1 hypothetical protein GA0070612_5752 [Micromonospora chokoriensis]
MIRLVAEDPAVSLDEGQARRIQFWLLEMVPARSCDVRRAPTVEITITGPYADELYPPLLERVEAIAGCRFGVITNGG